MKRWIIPPCCLRSPPWQTPAARWCSPLPTAPLTARFEVTDRRVRFSFRVYDDVTEIAHGEHERYLVDADRFLKKAENKA